MTEPGDAGPNAGLVDDLYRRWREDPSSVPESWRAFFAGSPPTADAAAPPAAETGAPSVGAPPPSGDGQTKPAREPSRAPPPVVLEDDEPEPLRGPAARTAVNMEASLGVPTATSVRAVPAKLLEVNRQILNNHLARTADGKVSFTHLIAYAVVEALRDSPALNASYGVDEQDKPVVVHHRHVNLGLAVDHQRADGTRVLLVPNIKNADTLSFAELWRAYEDLIAALRANKLSPDAFAGTTCTITNPGMIGTIHSVPRLMPGQGFILGVGALGYPAEWEGADPAALAKLGVSKIITLTNTYDHRIIGGAESGEFLSAIHDRLLGQDEFYDRVFESMAVPYEPARWHPDRSAFADPAEQNAKTVHVHQLINMYRVRGHLIANLDPLVRGPRETHPELDLAHYGLTIWDLDREFPVGNLGAGNLPGPTMPLRDIFGVLRDAYSRTIGVEYMHIQETDQKEWIQARVEGRHVDLTIDEKHRILERLNAAESFERFLHTKYLGQKRFSLEGAETLIPMLDALASAAAEAGVEELVTGMAHRGRLNVLANVVGKSYGQIFREFEGELDPTATQGSGDVKYHLGAIGKHTAPSGQTVNLRLAANPSHLEAVDPVVEGMARARGDELRDPGRDLVLPVLIHGDAAFAGQGVVAETLNLSEVDGYDVGGTVHVVVNNQLGFTTPPESGRSSVYATDVAKMVQAPIFHVNGDDPEAAVRVVRLAFDFRRAFKKDVVVDMICYRRYGHNEADEPAFTQPHMYELIEARESVRQRYTNRLVHRGDLTEDDAAAVAANFELRLAEAFQETHEAYPNNDRLAPEPPPPRAEPKVTTAVGRETLDRVVNGLLRVPDGFTVHPKLARILATSQRAFANGEVEWAVAEACAFGSLVLEGTAVRLAGQDTRRGTFSQRHGVLVDSETEDEYVPLDHLDNEQARFMLYDSVLSEYAALGFEYGYSVSNVDALVAWEAQFGDFMNGGQVIIDQYIVAADDKWGQQSALALLLPHGFEGQGPEHSSARIERFLALCADDNLRVVYPSTAAQYFHVLRRQGRSPRRVPMVCFTPKRYLRAPSARSRVDALTSGGFELALDDRAAPDPGTVRRVLLCTGKIGHELMDARDQQGAPVAVVRIEQLYPWPEAEVQAVLDRYSGARTVWWVQEEPANMGAWTFVRDRIDIGLRDGPLRRISREASPSPATGSATVHERQQRDLIAAALATA
ncbi:MAG: multifunctional oxoglutarate decarboxylase/oxoglutarate dehydrogenase thiamine pyrophosphate-binding subunit/dihydrolipoyllysine-residue succinyltransferase subunit [Actinobacteria bacterium]|nr:MAG: multifunctional oxoglutarate decarboxylase/oxoglutarate dehydrogenase thiamine pyrophosphate-binding subunit/dihydrolipoyllysine-residue succinyltransferase subunit [Actinomycetota bacterium]